MKLFGGRKAPEQSTGATLECAHPLTDRIVMREDPLSPHRVTGLRCARCGQPVALGSVPGPEKN